jgi:hypothetical protein
MNQAGGGTVKPVVSKKKASRKNKSLPGLLKKPVQTGGSWEAGKISEMIIDFARPLLEVDGGPSDIEALRNVILLANICWNVPILEQKNDPELARHLHLIDELPEPLRGLLRLMIRERKTRFGAIPFLVVATVRGTSLDDAVVQAEARMSPGPSWSRYTCAARRHGSLSSGWRNA